METESETYTGIKGGLPVSPQQEDVVNYAETHKVTVVGAGAGSGKTHTTIATALDIVETVDGASIDQFVLITFTKKAADKLRADIEKWLRQRRRGATTRMQQVFWQTQLERLAAAYIGTIHGFCRSLLKTFGYDEQIARESDVSFAKYVRLEAHRDALEHHALEPAGFKVFDENTGKEAHELLKLMDDIYEEIQNRGFKPIDVADWTANQPEDPGKPYRLAMARLISDAARRYEEAKAERQMVDSHDLLIRTFHLLNGSSDSEVAARVSRRYRYLFIDEFQDTNQLQKDIVEALIPHLAGILVVGDRKQSIYRFRGAKVYLLEEMARQHMQRDPLPLNVSRRPTLPFLNAQNALFTSMQVRFPDLGELLEAWTGSHTPTAGPLPFTYINVGGFDTTPDERIMVTAEKIRKMIGQPIELDPGNHTTIIEGHIVVLVRANHVLHKYVAGLQDAGLDARAEASESFYRRPEIVATYRMLRLILRYPDDTALTLALATPYFWDVDAAEKEAHLVQSGSREANPLLDWFEWQHTDHEERLKQLRASVRSETVPQLLERLYRIYGIREYYLARENTDAVKNLERLRSIARNIMAKEQAMTLRPFVKWLQIAIATDREETPIEPLNDNENNYPPYIRVMTIHRAKGLEFPIVVLPEVQEDLRREYLPPAFLILDGHGLEVELGPQNVDISSTLSPAYEEALQEQRDHTVEEEMRIFYVAITRAEHAVIAVGSGSKRLNSIGDQRYSWRDEILRAYKALKAKGGHFELSW